MTVSDMTVASAVNALQWTEYLALKHAGAARAMAQVARALLEGRDPEELWREDAARVEG